MRQSKVSGAMVSLLYLGLRLNINCYSRLTFCHSLPISEIDISIQKELSGHSQERPKQVTCDELSHIIFMNFLK
jgi:hypothetical protein